MIGSMACKPLKKRERKLSTRSSRASASASLMPSCCATSPTTSWSIKCHARWVARRLATSPPPLPYSREIVTACIRAMAFCSTFCISSMSLSSYLRFYASSPEEILPSLSYNFSCRFSNLTGECQLSIWMGLAKEADTLCPPLLLNPSIYSIKVDGQSEFAMIGICYGQKSTGNGRQDLLRLPNGQGGYRLACVQIPLCPDWRRALLSLM